MVLFPGQQIYQGIQILIVKNDKESKMVELEIAISHETKKRLTEELFKNSEKSLSQIVEESLSNMLDKLENDPEFFQEFLQKIKSGK